MTTNENSPEGFEFSSHWLSKLDSGFLDLSAPYKGDTLRIARVGSDGDTTLDIDIDAKREIVVRRHDKAPIQVEYKSTLRPEMLKAFVRPLPQLVLLKAPEAGMWVALGEEDMVDSGLALTTFVSKIATFADEKQHPKPSS